jgi:hypothetical protein
MMAIRGTKTLFYSSELSNFAIQQIFLGLLDPPADNIDFPDESGGEASRDLAIPLLRNVGEIRVEQAELHFVSSALEVEIHSHRVVNNGLQGVYIALAKQGLLKKVTLEYTPPASNGKAQKIVVRAAQNQGSGFTAGPPLFAAPAFASVGDMFGPALPSFSVTNLDSTHKLITLPSVMGTAWLFQLAETDDNGAPNKLSPLNVPIKINSVVLDSVPTDLTILLASSAGDITLWNSPGLLLPSQDEKVVSFTPIAQKHLTEKLKNATAADAALPVSLKFRTSSGGRLAVRSKDLRGVYVGRPLDPDPAVIQVPGDRADANLSLPVGLTPTSNSVQITVRLTGKQRAAASSESPYSLPVGGLQVDQTQYVAAGVPVAASDTTLTAIRLYLAAQEAAEAVLTVCADAAGAPGEVMGKPSVVKLQPGPGGWHVFTLPAPLTLATNRLWLALRTNVGSLLWFMDAVADGTPMVSADKAATWGSPDLSLAGSPKLLAQLWIDVGTTASAAPVLRLERDGVVLNPNLLSGVKPQAGGEFATTVALTAPFLTAQVGSGKVSRRFQLASAGVVDVTLQNFELIFDPGA